MAWNVNLHATTYPKVIHHWMNNGDKRAAREVDMLRRRVILATREKAIRNIVHRIQKVAVTEFMSDGGGAPQSGITTKRTHNLEQAVINQSHPSHVENIKTSAGGTKFRAVFGVKDDDTTPYASVQEVGTVGKGGELKDIDVKNYSKMTLNFWDGSRGNAKTVSIAARPYMHPAYAKVMSDGSAIELVDIEIQKIIQQMNFLR